MTNREINTTIKTELKAAGYSAKDFRVSVKYGLYDRAIHVTVRNPLVRIPDIYRILRHWESYELDRATGEILQGGNDYLFVQYDFHAFDNIPSEYTNKATALLSDLEQYNGREIAANESGASLHLLQEGIRYCLIECNHGTMERQKSFFFYNSIELAEMLFRFANLGTAAV